MAQVVDEMMSVLRDEGPGICCKMFVNGIADDKIRVLLAVAPASGRRRRGGPARPIRARLAETFVPEDAERRRTARMPVRRKAVRKKPDAPIPAEKGGEAAPGTTTPRIAEGVREGRSGQA